MSITARAGRLDLQVARGAVFAKAIQCWTPAPSPVPVETLVAGDRVFYDQLPEIVYSIRVEATRVMVALREGTFSDPWFETRPGQTVTRARARDITWCRAAYSQLADPPNLWTVQHVEIPTEIVDGTIRLVIEPEDTLQILPGAYSWDLLADVDNVRARLLEGTMVVLTAEAAEPDYTIPPLVEVTP